MLKLDKDLISRAKDLGLTFKKDSTDDSYTLLAILKRSDMGGTVGRFTLTNDFINLHSEEECTKEANNWIKRMIDIYEK